MLIDDGSRGLSKEVIGVAIEVHRKYGPGLLEDAYCRPLAWALGRRGFEIETEVPLSLEFEGQVVQRAYVIDIVVRRGDRRILLEIKSVAMILPIHISQVRTYLSLSGIPVGLLMNFNVQVLRHGIKRVLHPRSQHRTGSASESAQAKYSKTVNASEAYERVVEGNSGDEIVKRPSTFGPFE